MFLLSLSVSWFDEITEYPKEVNFSATWCACLMLLHITIVLCFWGNTLAVNALKRLLLQLTLFAQGRLAIRLIKAVRNRSVVECVFSCWSKIRLTAEILISLSSL